MSKLSISLLEKDGGLVPRQQKTPEPRLSCSFADRITESFSRSRFKAAKASLGSEASDTSPCVDGVHMVRQLPPLPACMGSERDSHALSWGERQAVSPARRASHTQFSIAGTTPEVSQWLLRGHSCSNHACFLWGDPHQRSCALQQPPELSLSSNPTGEPQSWVPSASISSGSQSRSGTDANETWWGQRVKGFHHSRHLC